MVNEGNALSRYSMGLSNLERGEHVGKQPALRLPVARYATPIVKTKPKGYREQVRRQSCNRVCIPYLVKASALAVVVCVVLHPKATPFLILKQRPYTGSMSRLGIRVALVIVFYTYSCLNVTSPVFRQWILTQAGEAIPTYCQLCCTTSCVPIGHPLRAASIKHVRELK